MLLWTSFVPSLCPVCKEIWGWCLRWQRSLSTNNVRIEKGILPLFSTEPASPLQVYMTLQLLSTQAVEFCSTASVWGYKEALLPRSQLRDAKFRSLCKKVFLTGSACSSFDTSCEKTPGQNNNILCGNMQEYIFVCHLNQHRIPTLEKMLLMSGLS